MGEYAYLNNVTVAIDRNPDIEDDEEEIGSAECFPIELKKDERIYISGIVASDYITGYQNVYTTIVLTYTYGNVKLFKIKTVDYND